RSSSTATSRRSAPCSASSMTPMPPSASGPLMRMVLPVPTSGWSDGGAVLRPDRERILGATVGSSVESWPKSDFISLRSSVASSSSLVIRIVTTGPTVAPAAPGCESATSTAQSSKKDVADEGPEPRDDDAEHSREQVVPGASGRTERVAACGGRLRALIRRAERLAELLRELPRSGIASALIARHGPMDDVDDARG